VNHPFEVGGFLTEGLECGGTSPGAEFTGEAQRAVAEGLAQLPQELLAEAMAEDATGKKEGIFAARDPS
jgi:hypothetical protein